MPKQVGKSSLLSKLGDQARKAHAAHKDDPVNYGNPSVPAGIENGIAQVVDIKFGEYKDGPNKGKPFFMAQAIIKEPKEHDGAPIEGLRTQIGPEALCNTPQATGKRKTFDDHYQWMLNEVKKLLGPDNDVPDVDDLESTLDTLKEGGVCTRFRTWKGKKQTTGTYAGQEPRVNHEWNGRVEMNGAGNVTEDVQDDTAGDAVADDVAENTGTDEGDIVSDDASGEVDLAGLAEAAEGGDEDAKTELENKALELGYTRDQLEKAADWPAVVEMIESGAPADEETPGEDTAPEPAKGEVWQYSPIDPKTKKPVKKPIEVEILTIDKKAKVATVKDAALNKPIIDLKTKKALLIKWDMLQPSS